MVNQTEPINDRSNMSSDNENDSRSPKESEIWDSSDVALALMHVINPALAMELQSDDEEEDDEDVVEESPPTVANRNLLLVDPVQQVGLVNRGEPTIEDNLFVILANDPHYDHMSLLTDSANNPTDSLLATLPESHYWNNVEKTQQHMESLVKVIAKEAYEVKRNQESAKEAGGSLEKATIDRDDKKAAYLQAERFLQSESERKVGYDNAAVTTQENQCKHELELRVVTCLHNALKYVVSLRDNPELHTTLPYGKMKTVEDRKRLGKKVFKLKETSMPRASRAHILIARALKFFGFELSEAGQDFGSALKVGNLKTSELLAQTRGVFCFPEPAALTSRKRSLPSSTLVTSARKKIPKRMAAILDSPHGKIIKQAVADLRTAQSDPGQDDRKPPAASSG